MEEQLVAKISADIGQFQASMRQMQTSITQMGQQSQEGFRHVDQGLKHVNDRLKTTNQHAATLTQTWRSFQAVLVTGALATFVRDATQASVRMTALDTSFKVLTGSVQAARTELDFVRQTADRLGLNFVQAAEQMRSLIAAARNTTLEGEPMRELFVAIQAAARGMGLDAERTGRVLASLTKIISTGTVQSDELRGMLAENLPGGFQIAARAMGKTTTELSKLLETGRLLSTEFIPKLTRQLSKELGGAAEEGSRSYLAAMARMENATTTFSTAFGNMITKNPRVIDAINAIAGSITELASTMQRVGPIAAEFFAFLAKGAAATAQGFSQLFGGARGLLLELNIVAESIQKQQALVDKLQATAQDPTQRTMWQLQHLGNVKSLDQELEAANAQLAVSIQRRTQLMEALMPPPLPPVTVTAPKVTAQQVQLEKYRAMLSDITKEAAAARQRIADIQDLLAAGKRGDLPLTTDDIKALNVELKAAQDTFQKLTDPIDKSAQALERLATAGDLKTKIEQLKAWIAAQSDTEKIAVALGQLDELQQKYNEKVLSGLPEVIKEYRLLQQELDLTSVKFTAVAESLPDAEFALAAKSVQELQNHLEDVALEVLPQSAAEYRKLERDIRQAEERFAAFKNRMTGAEVAAETQRIREMQQQLLDLSRTGLPDSVMEMLHLEDAIRAAMVQMVLFKDSLTTEQLTVFTAAIDAMLERFAQMQDVSPAPDVNRLRQTTREMERVKAALDAATDPTEIRLLNNHMKDLENTSDSLGKTLREVLVAKGLVPASQALGDYADQIDGGMANVREFIDQQHELAMVMALTPKQAREEMARYIAELKKAGVGAADIQRVQFEQARDELQKTRDVIDETVKATSDFLFDLGMALTDSATSVKDVWRDTMESLQRMFLKMLTDMAAKALVSNINIPVSLGGTGQAGTGGIDLSSLLQGLLGSTGGATTSVPGATISGGTQSFDEFGAVSTGTGGATAVGSGATAVSGVSAGTAASAVGGGLAAGTFTSSLFTQAGWKGPGANVAAGAVGGAVAGTLIAPGIGTVIGAALGALIPALMDPNLRPALVATLPGMAQMNIGKQIASGRLGEAALNLSTAGLWGFLQKTIFGDHQLPQFLTAMKTTGFPTEGFRQGPFGFVGVPSWRELPPGGSQADFAQMFLAVDEALAAHLTRRQTEIAAEALQAQRQGITLKFREFDNEIFDLTKDRMSTILKSLARDEGVPRGQIGQLAEQVFGNIRRDDKNLEQLEQAFAQAASFLDQLHTITTEPLSQAEQALAALNEQFDVLTAQAKQYGIGLRTIEEARKREIIQFFEDVVKNLKIQQENLLRSIAGARQFVTEITETPAVIFQRRQEELQQLQTEFMAATGARQIAMAPELLQRIQQLMQASLSEDVLGQDREMVLRLRQDLLSFIDDIEALAGEDAFDKQIARAEAQITAIKDLRTVTDTQLTEANLTLRRIEQFLMKATQPFVGEFQTGGRVPQTGLALVHRGETVLPPGVSTEVHMPVNITINASGGMSRQEATAVANTVWQVLEDKARRREIPLRLESR